MAELLNLRTMKDIAEGEVNSLMNFIRHHRAKRARGEAWFIQQEQILQHRRQVVKMINDEISRRQEKGSSMKPVLMAVYSEELTLWTAFEEAKKRSERTGSFADAVEAKRCLKAFYSYQCPIIQKNLGMI